MLMSCATGPGVRGFNPVWSFVDLDGKQFDDTFYMWVLENEIPYIPATVWHNPEMTIPWTNPIQFLANGTLPVDIYFDPSKVYRLEFRHNVGPLPPSQADPLIYLVPNYLPGTGQPVTPAGGISITENQITNAQFSIINFSNPFTFSGSNPNPIEIGPGWFLVLQGTGTVTIDRIPLSAPGLVNPTNAPYALRIVLGGGWSGIPYIRQRFQQNGMLWAGKHVSNSFTARIEGISQQVTARLVASDGLTLAVLQNAMLNNNFVEYKGTALLGPSINTDLPPNAFIEYRLSLPSVSDIMVTSFQLVVSDTQIDPTYEEDTIDRQIDHTFHYYKPQLEYKPIPSYLVGWDFSLNPAQFFGANVPTQAVGANKSFYAWDQTIVFQSVNNSVSVSREASTGGIKLTAAADTQLAIIQYLDQAQARSILQGNCSIQIKRNCSDLLQIGTLSLWAINGALPTMTTNDSIVATLGPNGEVTATNGAWTPLQRVNPGSTFVSFLPMSLTTSYNTWFDNVVTPLVNTATFFAIVIGVSEISTGESVTFDWITLNAGDIATRPAPMTFAENLMKCQEFYWKTFNNNIQPATAVGQNTGEVSWTTQAATINSSATIDMPIIMRSIPNVTLYNPVSANALARNIIVPNDATVTATAAISPKRFRVNATNAAPGVAGQVFIIHATADARLGIV